MLYYRQSFGTSGDAGGRGKDNIWEKGVNLTEENSGDERSQNTEVGRILY